MGKFGQIKRPSVLPILLVTSDAKTAAALSCRFAKRGSYFPVIDANHLDWEFGRSEAVQIINCAIRTGARSIIAVDLPTDSLGYLREVNGSSKRQILTLPKLEEAGEQYILAGRTPTKLSIADIGPGLLRALYTKKFLEFDEFAYSTSSLVSLSGHTVICERGDSLNAVIAANYAFALNANLKMIPELDRDRADDLVDLIHLSTEQRESAPSVAVADARTRLRELCGAGISEGATSLTFVGKTPYGFAFPELPTTHLPNFPYLGKVVVNGFAAEGAERAGVRVGCVIDPGQVAAPEILEVAETLANRGAFVRGVRGKSATARLVRETIELLPYDLLVIATHCGDTSGWRRTYEFADAAGQQRIMVVDVAATFDRPDADGQIHVIEFIAPVSIDGVAWRDPDRDAKVKVGSAFKDLSDRIKDKDFHASETTKIDRVPLSAALAAADGNCLILSRNIGGHGTPIVINNACSSWRRLSSTFFSAGCRSYIGTLFSINDMEAEHILKSIFRKHHEKPLPVALWAAQRDAYGSDVRHPYVHEGVFTQYINVVSAQNSSVLKDKISEALKKLKNQREKFAKTGTEYRSLDRSIDFYEAEYAPINKYLKRQ